MAFHLVCGGGKQFGLRKCCRAFFGHWKPSWEGRRTVAECEFGVAMCGCLLGSSNEALVVGVNCTLAWLLALCIVDCDIEKLRKASQRRYICRSSFNIAAQRRIATTAGGRCDVIL